MNRELHRRTRGVWSGSVCGNDLWLIAAATEPEPAQQILRHIGEPPPSPLVTPARSPPLWEPVDWNHTPADDPDNGEPAPAFQCDRTVSW